MAIIAVIPARGGSKRIPHKNIKDLCGKPMIAYTIEDAKKSDLIEKIVVTTEDEEIANIAQSYGAEIVDRPKELATDTATTTQTLRHAINQFGYDNIAVLLQPTSPLRQEGLIDKCIKTLIHEDCDAVMTVEELKQPWIVSVEDTNKINDFIPMDDIKYYALNGSVFVVKQEVIDVMVNEKEYLIAVLLKHNADIRDIVTEHSVDVDVLEDFKLAEKLLREQQ
jgi:CMP-N-acetylneuraminic acid synthetase